MLFLGLVFLALLAIACLFQVSFLFAIIIISITTILFITVKKQIKKIENADVIESQRANKILNVITVISFGMVGLGILLVIINIATGVSSTSYSFGTCSWCDGYGCDWCEKTGIFYNASYNEEHGLFAQGILIAASGAIALLEKVMMTSDNNSTNNTNITKHVVTDIQRKYGNCEMCHEESQLSYCKIEDEIGIRYKYLCPECIEKTKARVLNRNKL